MDDLPRRTKDAQMAGSIGKCQVSRRRWKNGANLV
jgi:hypothetical protein